MKALSLIKILLVLMKRAYFSDHFKQGSSYLSYLVLNFLSGPGFFVIPGMKAALKSDALPTT